MRLCILIGWCFSLLSYAQNLVPNPSFECGEDFCGAYQPEQTTQFHKYACDWRVPTLGTTDIFTTKNVFGNPACYTSMPFNISGLSHIGTQRPRTGARFAGIFTYSKFLSPDTTSYREYLEVKLNQPITPGARFCAGMYVSLAESSRWAANNLGMSFTADPISRPGYFSVLTAVPHIVSADIISDTTHWVQIGADFVPDKVYDYLLIGNFKSDRQTLALPIFYARWFPYYQGYYFIDDVYVERYPDNQFVISGIAPICEGEPITMVASAGLDNTSWSLLSDTSQVVHVGTEYITSLHESTSFRVKAKGCGKTIIDTIKVVVNEKPQVDLGPDQVLCKPQTILLDAGASFDKFNWQGEPGYQTFTVKEPGTYRVEAETAFNCKSSDEVTIHYDDVPKIRLGNDTLICQSKLPIYLSANVEADQYLWSTGSAAPFIAAGKSGTYWLEALNHCGSSRDSIEILTENNVTISNAVTPNNDGLNDAWQVRVLDADGRGEIGAGATKVGIYDRWGKVVFTADDYRSNWPSAKNDLASGTYYYYVEQAKCPPIKGWLQLIR